MAMARAGARIFVGAAPFSPSAPPEHRGGLYRRDEAGGEWEELTVGLPERPEVRAVELDPRDPDVVYAGAQDGPYRSTDGGDTWERLGFPTPGLQVWSLAFHPADATIMYLGVGPATVYRSTDAGDTWHHLQRSFLPDRVEMGFPTRLISLAVDPTDPDQVWAGVEVGGVLRSPDGGETWVDCTPGLVALAERPHLRSRIGSDTDIEGMLDTHALALTAARPGVAFLALRMGVFRTADGGQTWEDIEIGRFSPLTYCRDIVVAPSDPDVVYACLSPAALSTDGSLYRSDDAGETWRRFDSVAPRSTLMQVAAHPGDAERVVCATREGEVFHTLDGGATWAATPLPAGGRDFYGIAYG
jgi:photosystem II stability/assembly factor-like uncharacterized protein